MNQSSYTTIMYDQTRRALWSIRNIIDCIPDTCFYKKYCGMPLWKHVYHTLHSLDQWFINPRMYKEPPFHQENLSNLDICSPDSLSPKELMDYFLSIESKITLYLTELSDDILLDKPKNCEWTRFTLMLAQHRHLHSHMGMLMGFIIAETGLWPRVIGLEEDIPTEEYTPYF